LCRAQGPTDGEQSCRGRHQVPRVVIPSPLYILCDRKGSAPFPKLRLGAFPSTGAMRNMVFRRSELGRLAGR
jgi:hypothetical protein